RHPAHARPNFPSTCRKHHFGENAETFLEPGHVERRRLKANDRFSKERNDATFRLCTKGHGPTKKMIGADTTHERIAETGHQRADELRWKRHRLELDVVIRKLLAVGALRRSKTHTDRTIKTAAQADARVT